MKCPKCGAVIEEGKTVCFMCGASVDVGSNGFGGGSSDGFSTGFGGSSNNNTTLDNYNPSLDDNYYRMKEEYNNNKNNYKGNYKERREKITNPSDKKDMFDFISEHKTIIKIVLLLLVLALVAFLISKWYKKKTTIPPKEPVVNNALYFVVPKEFKEINNGNGGSVMYTLSGDKGNACSILVQVGPSTNEDVVSNYYKNIRVNAVAGIYDNDFEIKDYTKIPLFQEDQVAINGVAWYYLYEYYRLKYPGDYVHLKNKYLNAVKDGYVYSIVLTNNDNDTKCNLYLDNFARTLEFVESK